MRRSKEQTAYTRQHIIKETATLIRECGIERVSVVNLMDAAGMTHGGFYKHFPSKEELVVEAIASIFEERHAQLAGESETQRGLALRQFIEDYLSLGHIQNLGKSCAIAALAADTAKLSGISQDVMARGTKETINLLNALTVQPQREKQKKRQAIELLCVLVGTVVVARALSGESATQKHVLEIMRHSQLIKNFLRIPE